MNRNKFLELIRFCLVGGISLIVDYAVLYSLVEFLKIHYLYSSAIAFTISVIFNYWLCVKYVFKVSQQSTKQAILFISSSVVGLVLNQIFMWLFVDLINIHYLIAKLGATVIVTAWNYVMKRKAIYI